MLKIRKGDDVIIRAGKFKGQKGIVDKVLDQGAKVVVSGINVVKRHVGKRVTGGEQGAIVEVARPLPAGKVSIVNKDGKPTRVRFATKDGKKIRLAVKGGEQV